LLDHLLVGLCLLFLCELVGDRVRGVVFQLGLGLVLRVLKQEEGAGTEYDSVVGSQLNSVRLTGF
jgi:hypothetical protein